jgi:hypothetical protein
MHPHIGTHPEGGRVFTMIYLLLGIRRNETSADFKLNPLFPCFAASRCHSPVEAAA